MRNSRWAALAVAWVSACAATVPLACGTNEAGTDEGAGALDASNGVDGTTSGDALAPGDAGAFTDAASDSPPLDASDAARTGLPDSASDGATPGDSGAPPACGVCPTDVTCGRYLDPCGALLACGSPCTGGKLCVPNSGASTGQSCQPKACAGRCGVVGTDSCGVAIACGGCDGGLSCVDNACVPPAPPTDAGSSCAAASCTPNANTKLCGTVTDGCGHAITCSCAAGDQCIQGVCTPPPPECEGDAGAKCGSVANACGSGNVTCAGCSGANKCVGGACTSCAPPACGAASCGTVSNGCGPSVSCGTCGSSEVCDDGGCCTPSTCAEVLDAGMVSGCGLVDLGCGVKKACVTCNTNETCVGNACAVCVAKTCADFGDAGCGHADGCGKTLNCCGAGTYCQGGALCCPEGQVSYQGSCCQPGCDPSQPTGSQVSCGQIIFCPG